MQNQGVGGARPPIGLEELCEDRLGDDRVFRPDEPNATGHTQDVTIDGKTWHAEGVAENDVRRLPSHTGQRDQGVQRCRNVSAVRRDEGPRHA